MFARARSMTRPALCHARSDDRAYGPVGFGDRFVVTLRQFALVSSPALSVAWLRS